MSSENMVNGLHKVEETKKNAKDNNKGSNI